MPACRQKHQRSHSSQSTDEHEIETASGDPQKRRQQQANRTGNKDFRVHRAVSFEQGGITAMNYATITKTRHRIVIISTIINHARKRT
jgi:hypothetical protein